MDARKLLVAAATLAFFSSFNSMPAAAQTISDSLSAVLLGGNECNSVAPPTGPDCRKGDPDAFGRATITFPLPTEICVTLQVDNLANAVGTTFAHIHSGRETVNGAILSVLPPPIAPFGGNPGVSATCAGGLAALVAALRASPGNFYVNVHNATFPGGAIRGQLF